MYQKELRYYQTVNGKAPFVEWMKKLKDPTIYARILRRLDRLLIGHYGDYKVLGDGIFELRLAFGSGYRIYFAEANEVTIILLLAGDKSTQSRDIARAKEYWAELTSRSL